jgi:hypothetical protein
LAEIFQIHYKTGGTISGKIAVKVGITIAKCYGLAILVNANVFRLLMNPPKNIGTFKKIHPFVQNPSNI